ncbi:hypothetical protein T439DRAFT_327590 [Meredithblackwellia eburnea MCA 4105]
MGAWLSTIDQSDYPTGPVATQLNADYTLGPCFFGWTMNCFLCGIALAWAATYRERSSGDRLGIKIAVIVAVSFEVMLAGSNLISIIQHGKSQMRDNDTISLVFSADAIGPTLGGVVAVAAQSFFASRCYALLPSRYRVVFLCVIGPLILAGFAGALGTTVIEYVNHGATDVTRGAAPDAYMLLYSFAMVWLWSNMVGDVLISTLLMFRLWQSRQKVAVDDLPGSGSRADVLINSLMRLSFETAVLTTVCAVVAAGLYVTTTETTNLSMALTDILPGLYCLSLLWALNARHRLKQEVNLNNMSEQIQLVWNLAEPNRAATQELRDHHTSQLAQGRHLNVQLRRTEAPKKAASQLGHSVKMVTIQDAPKRSFVDPLDADLELGGEEETMRSGQTGRREAELGEGEEDDDARSDGGETSSTAPPPFEESQKYNRNGGYHLEAGRGNFP